MNYPVMNTIEPSLQVGKDKMDHRQMLFGNLGIAPFRPSKVFIPALGESGVAAPVIGDDHYIGSNDFFNETAKRFCATVLHDGEPNSCSFFADALQECRMIIRIVLRS